MTYDAREQIDSKIILESGAVVSVKNTALSDGSEVFSVLIGYVEIEVMDEAGAYAVIDAIKSSVVLGFSKPVEARSARVSIFAVTAATDFSILIILLL